MITPEGYLALKKQINISKRILVTLTDLENQWEILSKNNCIYQSFWKIDKKILNIYKKLQNMQFSSFPIREQDELKGYIEHLEIQLEEYDADHERGAK